MTPGKMLPGQMLPREMLLGQILHGPFSLWQLSIVKGEAINLPLQFCQNRMSSI